LPTVALNDVIFASHGLAQAIGQMTQANIYEVGISTPMALLLLNRMQASA